MTPAPDTDAQPTARARAYALCGELLLRGVRPALRAWLDAIPELAATPGPDTPEGEAAEHHRVLTLEVFPYEQVFLGAGPVVIGGPVAESVAAAYATAGWSPDGDNATADHVGHELHFLAFLCRAGDHDTARAFLDDHLLRWLPALTWALETQGSPRFAAVARLALEAALDHRAALGGSPPEAPSLPTLDGLLDDPKTGLKRLSRALLRPAAAGWFLSAGDVARLAARVDVPHGFGGRTRMLESLVESARDYGRLPALAAALRDEVERVGARWAALAAEQPLMTAIAGAWQARLDATEALLDTLSRAAQDPTPPGPEPA